MTSVQPEGSVTSIFRTMCMSLPKSSRSSERWHCVSLTCTTTSYGTHCTEPDKCWWCLSTPAQGAQTIQMDWSLPLGAHPRRCKSRKTLLHGTPWRSTKQVRDSNTPFATLHGMARSVVYDRFFRPLERLIATDMPLQERLLKALSSDVNTNNLATIFTKLAGLPGLPDHVRAAYIERYWPVSQCQILSIIDHPSTHPTKWSLYVYDPFGDYI